MKRIGLALATVFGCGYFPYGPGTVGSLAGLAVAALVDHYLWGTRLFLFGSIFILLMPSIWASTVAAQALGRKDPGYVVIDEVLGQWVALLGAAAYSWPYLLAAFLLFRIFDIWKPWPARQLENLPDGYGIVADDLMAGAYAALILYIGGYAISNAVR